MEFLYEVMQLGELATMATVWEVLFTALISLGLGLLIAYTYSQTYNGRYYSQSYVHTLVMMCIVISVVIVVIGSNIARAFSLAGALSIIRFRSAIRDPKDVAFIFFAMGAGLAVGAGLPIPGIVFSFAMCGVVTLLHKTNFGGKPGMQKLLKITVPENLNFTGMFDDVLAAHLEEYKFLSVHTTNLGTMFELVYSVRNKSTSDDKQLIDDIRSRNGNLNVTILLDQQQLD